jgi:predicted phage tail protein
MVRLTELDGATTFLDATVAPRTTYNYAVQAINPASEGEPTDALSILMPDVPSPPMNLTTFAGDSEVWLTWSSPVDDGGAAVIMYLVLRGDSIDDMVEIARLVILKYNDLGVLNGRTYFYSVRALNAVGTGAPSNVVTTAPAPPPGAPISLKLELSDNDVTLKWAPPGEGAITSYEVLRGPSKDGLVPIAEVTGQLTYTDRDVARGRTYYYTVRANSPSGEGETAEPVRLTVESPVDISMIVSIVLLVVVIVLLGDLIMRKSGKGSKEDDTTERKVLDEDEG